MECRIDVSKNQFKNQYIIRTQPEEGFVSTLEAISAALAESEGDNTLYEKLTAKGIWDGDRPSKNRNKLNRERLLIERYNKQQLEQNNANEEEIEKKCF